MGNDRMPHTHDFRSALNSELEKCQASYQDLSDRHSKLNAALPLWPECTGIIYEMASLEKAMKGWRQKMAEIMAILRGEDPEGSTAQ